MKKLSLALRIVLFGTALLLGACTDEQKQAGPVTTAPALVASDIPAKEDMLVSRTLTIAMPGMNVRKVFDRAYATGWVEGYDHRNGITSVISLTEPYLFNAAAINAEGASRILQRYKSMKGWDNYSPVIETRTKSGPLYIWNEKDHNCVIYGQFLLSEKGIISNAVRPENSMANVFLSGRHCGESHDKAINGLMAMLNSVTMN